MFMKNFSRLVAIVTLVLAVGFTARADRHVDVSQLPAEAQSFIKKHYASVNIRECEQDNGYFDVELKNGVDMAFDSNGRLVKLEAGNKKISQAILKEILPAKIYTELSTRNVLNKVEEIEFNHSNIKIETSEWFKDEYRFGLDGSLISVTD